MKRRESETVEFKKSTSELKESVISLSAMLNKHGRGEVYFGVKNDGTVVGQAIGAHTTSDISRAIKTHIKPTIVPTIEVVRAKGVDVVKVAATGEDTPYSAYGRYYIRSDDEDLIMSNATLGEFFLNQTYDYSAWEKEATAYGAEDIDEERLIRYVNEGNESGRIGFLFKDTETTLRKLELMTGDRLNNAGFYLFSNKKPLLLKLATYPTDERIRFSDMKQFRGNIFECIEEGIKYVSNNIRWQADIVGATRIETPEVPLEAFREIIVNSFAHMKVNPTSSNEIYITPTRIHVYNPGGLVPGTEPAMFATGEQGSMIRNPLISTVLYYNGTIDAFGTGFERVFRLCQGEGYQYQNNAFGFTFEFLRPGVDGWRAGGAIQGSADKLDEAGFTYAAAPVWPLRDDAQQVLELLSRADRRYTKAMLAGAIGKSVSTVNRILQDLTERELIERVGSNKTGYWRAK